MNRSILSIAAALALALVLSSSVFADISERAPSERTPDPAKTESFRSKRYGVFTHYLNGLQNSAMSIQSLGKETSWDECVSEFDVERFADDVAQTGAGYVFFTMHQQTQHFCAPNATFDRMTGYRPGEACSKRDLIAELADALEARGIDLYLYWTGDGPLRDPKATEGLRGSIPVTPEYMRNWAQVAAEYGRRYGKKVKGWWVDGSYSWIGHTEETRGILAEGLRAGNPDRILAFNPGVDPKVMAYSDYDDFTAGEQNSFASIPEEGRFLKGAQWHILTFLGNFWCQAGTKLTKAELADYVWTVGNFGGVVTIDLLLYRDGSLDRSQLETLKPLRTLLAQKDKTVEGRRANGDRAPGAAAFLRGADGQTALVPSCGPEHAAPMGVDGDPNTSAVGADSWNWTYLVCLPDEAKSSKVSVLFGAGWATDFEIFVKSREGDWESIGRFENPDGQKQYDVPFEARDVAAVKVVAYKPDGPDQVGVQMSIAELSVY